MSNKEQRAYEEGKTDIKKLIIQACKAFPLKTWTSKELRELMEKLLDKK